MLEKLRSKDTQQPNRINALLNEIMDRRPGLQDWWKKHQGMTLEHYAEELLQNPAQALQSREDVADVITQQAAMLGSQRARALGEQVLNTPVIITANHHGPDFIGLTRQGVGVLALALSADQNVIVTACAGVPQNNLTYPRGIALAREQVKAVIDPKTQQPVVGDDGQVLTKILPVRINITPDSQRDTLVATSAPVTREMIVGDGKKNKGARGQVENMLAAGTISAEEAHALEAVLEDYLDPEVLSQPTFSDQITLLNDKLWKKEFSADLAQEIPGLAYLELEGVVGGLLEKDLRNPNSLVYQLFFDPSLRQTVLEKLDGVDACWSIDKLAKLTDTDHPLETQERIETMGGAGTMFFTGVDAKGRRVPLMLVGEQVVQEGDRRVAKTFPSTQIKPEMALFLRGTDKSGNAISVPFTPEALINGLQQKTIIPSVFTDFAEILSRGLRAHGGFNQGNYYPRIKGGIVDALQEQGRANWAKVIDTVPTDNLTAGLMFAVARYGEQLKAAGGIDLVANPLTQADYNKLRHLTVREAFLFGAPEMYRVVCPAEQRKPELLAITEQDIYDSVGDKYVTREY